LELTAVGGACAAGIVASKKRLRNALTTAVLMVIAKAMPHITIGARLFSFSISDGKLKLEILDLTVGNPEGFKSKHLAKIDRICVIVDAKQAVKSALCARGMPSEVHVDLVQANGCQFAYEKDKLSNSNFKELLKNLQKEDEADKKAEDEAQKEAEGDGGGAQGLTDGVGKLQETGKGTALVLGDVVKDPLKHLKAEKKEEREGKMKLLLHQVDITEISVEVVMDLMTPFGGDADAEKKDGHKMPIANIKIADFSKECGTTKPVKAVREMIKKIMVGIITGCANLASAGHNALREGTQESWSWMTGWFS